MKIAPFWLGMFCLLMLWTTAPESLLADPAPAGESGGGGGSLVNPPVSSVRGTYAPLTVGDYFSCEVPTGWDTEGPYDGLSQDETKVYGFELSRYAGEAVPLRMSVYYYAEGNLLHATPEQYIASRSHPVTQQVGPYRYGEVSDAVVAGRPARTFMRPHRQFVAAEPLLPDPAKDDTEDVRVYERHEMMARQVALIERYVVVPAGTGFFALAYSAPEQLFEASLDAFEHVLATFSPLR